eukprot:NODE_110_length_19453_cov_0.364369.p7 type:complete len:260 gc:universal NODE_110_length_19453_cov_0.364369:16775-15996(-)
MTSRPELILPPELYYNDEEALKYTNNSHVIDIQRKLTARAIELLNLKSGIVLDIGCGSGLSSDMLSENGFQSIGVDISPGMLKLNEAECMLADMGDGISFRPGSLDGIISISALQWLCTVKGKQSPHKRLEILFNSCYSALRRGGRAVFQFYPMNDEQIQMITSQALNSGFSGGLLIDYPNSTKAKKYFLTLFAGMSREQVLLQTPKPQGMQYSKSLRNKKSGVSKKEWIKNKKALYIKRGINVPLDSKYTGRKRSGGF